MALGWYGCFGRTSDCELEYANSVVITPMVLETRQSGRFETRRDQLQLRFRYTPQGSAYVLRFAPTLLRSTIPVTPAPVSEGISAGATFGIESPPFPVMPMDGELRLVADLLIVALNRKPAPFVAQLGVSWRPAAGHATTTKAN
jgi:hypothetical protein